MRPNTTKMLEIQENAVFIADSHHHNLYQDTLNSLFSELLKSSKRQIFLMGDIFDFLVGPAKKSIEENQSTLELLEKLSLRHEIHYFEGNHDFLLKQLPYFKNIHYYPLSRQPVCFLLNQKKAYLAHGDIFLGLPYRVFAWIERQEFLIKFLNLFSKILYPKIIAHLQRKRLRKASDYQNNTKDFHTFATSRINCYVKKFPLMRDSYIIEGHFHKGQVAKIKTMNYIGLPFFACKKKYFIVEYADNCLTLKEFGSVKL